MYITTVYFFCTINFVGVPYRLATGKAACAGWQRLEFSFIIYCFILILWTNYVLYMYVQHLQQSLVARTRITPRNTTSASVFLIP